MAAKSSGGGAAFHQIGRFKWQWLDLDYTLRDLDPRAAKAAQRACEVFREAGLKPFRCASP